jgi:hypothetical protein
MSETPILDRREPVGVLSRARRPKLYDPGFLGLVVLGLLTASVLLPIVAWLPVCVALHEVGHLLAGLLVGWEFRYLLAGPLAISKEAKGLEFSLAHRRLLGGGRVLMVPRGLESLRRNQLIVIAGGPIITAVMFIPVLVLPWNQFTIGLCVANALVAIGSWAPMTIGAEAADAKLFIRFARSPSESFAAISQLWALDYAGTKPSDWPPQLVNRLALRVEDDSCGTAARQLRYLYLRECGDSSEASVALESVLAVANKLTPDERRRYFSEAAFFQGVFRRNSALAKEWLDEARRVKVSLPERDWEDYALAAIAVAEGQPEAARPHFLRVIRILDRTPGNSGSVAALRIRLTELMA